MPLSQLLTLSIDTSQRFCVGWRDLATGKRFACLAHVPLEGKYEQCPLCQKKTGFNPAFYHASSVSPQQEARNQEPHKLYLAHFGPGIIKVGLSYAGRADSRLLEQGARTALVLGTFPSAHIARQYEARIAAMEGFVETIQVRRKIELLASHYTTAEAVAELLTAREILEQSLAIQFTKAEPKSFDSLFFPGGVPDLASAYDCTDYDKISGTAIGMLGSLLFCMQIDIPLFLPLKRYVGYPVAFSYTHTPLQLPARQTSLF